MNNFIKVKWERQSVNLDRVAYIHFSKDCSEIYFAFDSMNESEVNEVVWRFDCKIKFNIVRSYIDGITAVIC